MPLKLTNLTLRIEEPEETLAEQITRRLGIRESDLSHWRILKKSLDARRRSDLKFVYAAAVELQDGVTPKKTQQAMPLREIPFVDPPSGTDPMAERPVIVGTGPAGLMAGYYLARRGYRPLLIERGKPVKHRVPDIRAFDRGGEFQPESNYLFGEGGAGAFSDGKLTCRMTGPDVDYVLERFVECGGRPSLVYENRPHLGSNKLPMICRNFRRKIDAMGGQYQFDTALERLDLQDGRVVGIHTNQGYIRTSHLILAIGHSARDTYETLLEQGVPLRQKAFQLGLRIEQPQEQINRHKYGRDQYLNILGAADYSLIVNGPHDVFTFCMCAGGWIIPSISEAAAFCTNGMSNSRHETGFANSGVMITLEPEEFGSDHPLAGMLLQRKYEQIAYRLAGENYHTPVQRANDFVNGSPPLAGERIDCSYQRGSTAMRLDEVLPPVVVAALQRALPLMDEKFRGDLLKNAVLVGPEMRGSSPVRIDRDPVSRACPNIAGLYPIGEGAGYAGGIVTAAVDGLRTAATLVKNYAPV